MGAWIEILAIAVEGEPDLVAPLVGAWIEILYPHKPQHTSMSLLSWERGLKYGKINYKVNAIIVAPLVGAWIEIILYLIYLHLFNVAPLVGAWIEIDYLNHLIVAIHVAPLVGAWIEIAV